MELTEREQQAWDQLLDRIIVSSNPETAREYSIALHNLIEALCKKNELAFNDEEE